VVIYNRLTDTHDSAAVKNGRFVITVPFREASRYMFYSKYEAKKKGGYSPFGILVTEPCEITMKVDMASFGATTVSGSAENDLYNKYAAVGNALQKKIMDSLGIKYGKEFLAKPDSKDPRYKAFVADYQAMMTENKPAGLARLKDFIEKNGHSFSAIYLLSVAVNDLDVGELERLYGLTGSVYKETALGKRIAEKIQAGKIIAIGKIAPEFEQPDTSGQMVRLSDFRGKYVLVDFWASWCGPCRQENPNVVKAFAQYKDKGFAVLGVSLDQPGKKEAWLAAIRKDNLTWTQVSDLKFWDNAVAKLYGIQAIPQNFLLDPQGKIIATNVSGEELNKKQGEIFQRRHPS
jgi:peroxiredoxin